MRVISGGRRGGLAIALAAGLVVGCGHSGTTSSGAFDVNITEEKLETVAGNRCAVKGNATNTGNVRANVSLAWEAVNASGAVIGTSTASFQVTAFSNFEFSNEKPNDAGQPSSTVFTNNLACSAISTFRRTQTNVSAA
jgi:hypothetical protein